MLIDTDPFWHIAAGDLIRQSGSIPEHDPWSFTAGNYRWLNVSWLWDTMFSYVIAQLGWQSAMAINALIIAFMLAVVFVHCLLRSGNGMASFTTVLLLFLILLLHFRPVHVTHGMTALWMLVLGLFVRNECRPAWLLVLPATMLVWVNMHGGFIIGFALTGSFFLAPCTHASACRRAGCSSRWL